MYDVKGSDSVQGAAGDSSIQMGQSATGVSDSREMGIFPPSGTPRDFRELKILTCGPASPISKGTNGSV